MRSDAFSMEYKHQLSELKHLTEAQFQQLDSNIKFPTIKLRLEHLADLVELTPYKSSNNLVITSADPASFHNWV